MLEVESIGLRGRMFTRSMAKTSSWANKFRQHRKPTEMEPRLLLNVNRKSLAVVVGAI